MTYYNVHVYREMRLRFDNIEATSPEEAAEKARDRHFDDADDWSDCEGESSAALVDVCGDDEFKLSRMIDFEPGRLLKAAPKLGAALAGLLDALGGLPFTIPDGPIHDACRHAEVALAESSALLSLTAPSSRFTHPTPESPPGQRKDS